MNETPAAPEPEADWPSNYFNYYTEIEEHFQQARGTGLFLLSPLDWALLDNWRQAGVPLGSVLKGIDEAFEKWRSRKQKRRLINSIAYCTQAVMEAAQRVPSKTDRGQSSSQPPFSIEELRTHLTGAAAALRQHKEPNLLGVAQSLESLSADAENQIHHLEDLERRLTSLEEKVVAALRIMQTDDELNAIRTALDGELKSYRGKMSAEQISMLERRYLDTALLERAHLPRLSLFYLH